MPPLPATFSAESTPNSGGQTHDPATMNFNSTAGIDAPALVPKNEVDRYFSIAHGTQEQVCEYLS